MAWLSIRSRGGTVVMRMEDLDHPKVKSQAAAEALEDLRWLGLDWDEGPGIGGPHGPYAQSERTAHYAEAIAKLHRDGRAYPCVCSRRDIETAQSAPHAGEDGLFYPGTCRGCFADYAAAAATLSDGRIPGWRFRVDRGCVRFDDGFQGPVQQNVAESVGDFALARHEAGAGYMLGVVVDDAAMGISEVLRGDDLLPATHRQILIYRALELDPPHFVHVPLVTGPDGRRLAKRHGDTRIRALREAGVSPERVVGLLARWCGWAAQGEAVTASALVDRFELGTIPRGHIVLQDCDLTGLM